MEHERADALLASSNAISSPSSPRPVRVTPSWSEALVLLRRICAPVFHRQTIFFFLRPRASRVFSVSRKSAFILILARESILRRGQRAFDLVPTAGVAALAYFAFLRRRRHLLCHLYLALRAIIDKGLEEKREREERSFFVYCREVTSANVSFV